MGLLSNRVEKTQIKAGDHIYTWRAVYTYAHHESCNVDSSGYSGFWGFFLYAVLDCFKTSQMNCSAEACILNYSCRLCRDNKEKVLGWAAVVAGAGKRAAATDIVVGTGAGARYCYGSLWEGWNNNEEGCNSKWFCGKTIVIVPQMIQELVESPQGTQELMVSPQGAQGLVEAPQGTQELVEAPQETRELGGAPQGTQELVVALRGTKEQVEAPQRTRELVVAPQGTQELMGKGIVLGFRLGLGLEVMRQAGLAAGALAGCSVSRSVGTTIGIREKEAVAWLGLGKRAAATDIVVGTGGATRYYYGSLWEGWNNNEEGCNSKGFVGKPKVVHFTREQDAGSSVESSFKSSHLSSKLPSACPTFPDCGFSQPNSGVVLSCLDCFLGNGSLYCFEYGVTPSVFLAKVRGGTCTTATSDSPETVIHRAMYLLQNGFGNYDVFQNNCEDFTLYCKTGLLTLDKSGVGRSGQASSVIGAPLAALLSSPLKLFMAGPVGVATATAGMYCMSRYATDIGVRTDVIKVAVEDMAVNLGWAGPHEESAKEIEADPNRQIAQNQPGTSSIVEMRTSR
ncbi:hypothetical protein HHK36_027443 [Tetracentron sinense]|uniref:LRAT domain-containing protein n=1 Tax=Tetracentron sinense TaxID=13715 RepID=A0A835D3J6_TETSI|nr:hypothetical protein HHK36_027443 [Tetracentron sinense]